LVAKLKMCEILELKRKVRQSLQLLYFTTGMPPTPRTLKMIIILTPLASDVLTIKVVQTVGPGAHRESGSQ